jgi:predicted amidophosphoribosyltransferase
MPDWDDNDDDLTCSHCGGNITASSAICRHCGFSEDYHESAEEGYAEDEFDYDAFIAREFPAHARHDPATVRRQMLKWVLIACLVASLVIGFAV